MHLSRPMLEILSIKGSHIIFHRIPADVHLLEVCHIRIRLRQKCNHHTLPRINVEVNQIATDVQPDEEYRQQYVLVLDTIC